MQLRKKLPKVRIKAGFGTPEFEAEVDAAIAVQIALYGDASDYINVQKQRNEVRPTLPATPPQSGTLRWLDRPEDAGALHRKGEPGKARA